MKNIKLKFINTWLLAGVLLLFTFGCTEDDDVLPADKLTGDWLGVFSTPLMGPGDLYCNGMFASFDGTDFKLVTFMEADQVAGMKGSYEYEEEEGLLFHFSHMWVEEEADWVQIPPEEEFSQGGIGVEFSSDGNTVTITEPEEGETQFILHKRTLTIPSEASGQWTGLGMLLTVSETGEFLMESDEGMDAGYLNLITDVGGTDYLLVHINESTVEADGYCNIYKLMGYDFNTEEDKFTLTDGDFEIVFSRLEPVEGDELIGEWLGIFDESFLGPGDRDCDAIYFQFDETDFKLLSFLESDQAAGFEGEYSFLFQGGLELDITSEWHESIFNWQNVQHTAVLPIIAEDDGNTLTGTDPHGEVDLVLHRTERSHPSDIDGWWVYIEDGDIIATFFIDHSDGSFEYDQSGELQSGYIWDIGEINGNRYLLSHIQHCDFVGLGENADFYTINRYEVDEVEPDTFIFKLWHGDHLMEFLEMPPS